MEPAHKVSRSLQSKLNARPLPWCLRLCSSNVNTKGAFCRRDGKLTLAYINIYIKTSESPTEGTSWLWCWKWTVNTSYTLTHETYESKRASHLNSLYYSNVLTTWQSSVIQASTIQTSVHEVSVQASLLFGPNPCMDVTSRYASTLHSSLNFVEYNTNCNGNFRCSG